MIKNQLYPYIESYINEYLYGFTKQQLEVGVMNGKIKLENLNLSPEGVNKKMDEKNLPIWIKAGYISKIEIGCSIMNFIGERPLDIIIEGFDIIVTPSYQWIIRNIDTFFVENIEQMEILYDPNDNNSMDIFAKKINILDNSIFKKDYIEEIFKDKTKVSELINKFFKFCFKFFYSQNYSINLKIKNLHIRLEDDQLINYNFDIALGYKIESLDLNLGSEGAMKKDSLKVNKLNIYLENPAKILIPSEILTNSLNEGKLDPKYYTNLKKIKFQEFKWNNNTKFLMENFSFSAKFGTKINNKGKIDIFSKNSNDYKFYFQFSSNEININFYPDLFIINNNFSKFLNDFSIIQHVQDFKPIKKPYNTKSQKFIEFMERLKANKKTKLEERFKKKKKFIVRDWLFYFYWCQKCKYSLLGEKIKPMRLEFSRFYNLCFGQENYPNEFNTLDNRNSIAQNEEDKKLKENYNPDLIDISYLSSIKIKGLNINLHPYIKSDKLDFISFKLNGIEIKLSLSKAKFDFDFNCKSIIINPNLLKSGEKVLMTNDSLKKRLQYNNTKNNFICENYSTNDPMENTYSKILDNLEENTGLVGLVKKFNPNYNRKLQMIDSVIEKLGDKQKKSNIDFSNKENDIMYWNKKLENNSQCSEVTSNHVKDTKSCVTIKISNRSNQGKESKGITSRHYLAKRKTSFAKRIISNFEGTHKEKKMELKKQKNNFSISQAINDYNLKKAGHKSFMSNDKYNVTSNSNNEIDTSIYITNNSKNSHIGKLKPSITSIPNPNKNKIKEFDINIVTTGEKGKINLFEIYNNNDSESAFNLKFTKQNNDNIIDYLFIKVGNIRLNLFSEYISNCLNIISNYLSILNQPIIKAKMKLDNNIMEAKQLLNMQKYILNYIQNLPEKKKNSQMKEYIKFLEKEIEIGKRMGIDSDIYEINYLFNFFPKGIEIIFDYERFECIYYNSKKDNKISGKAFLPSPELCFKLELNKIGVKFFEFQIELEDLDDAKYIMANIWKIIQDKIKIAKLFIEPCLAKARQEIKNKEQLEAHSTPSKKNGKMITNENKKKTLSTNETTDNNLIITNNNNNEENKATAKKENESKDIKKEKKDSEKKIDKFMPLKKKDGEFIPLKINEDEIIDNDEDKNIFIFNEEDEGELNENININKII